VQSLRKAVGQALVFCQRCRTAFGFALPWCLQKVMTYDRSASARARFHMATAL
jgi:hypothetical protein